MTVLGPYVDEATIATARSRAAQLPLSPTEQRRWQELADYAAKQPPDPTPVRATELADLVDLPGSSARDVMAAAGRLLADAATAPGTLPRPAAEVYARCREWFTADVEQAAPLLELFTGHHREPEGGAPAADPELVARIAGWLARRTAGGCTVESARMISGGFSRQMVDVRWSAGGHGVFRIEQDGMFGTDGRREAAAMRILAAAGYPVPAILWEEPDAGPLGHPFFVMEHVAGEARSDPAGLADVLHAIADLHHLDGATVDAIAALDGTPAESSPNAVVAGQLRHWYGIYRTAVTQPIPLLEWCFGWLRTHLAPTGPSVVVHGDPGPGNALQDDRGVTAVIDWEFAHAGDAAEDWAYLALIRGRRIGSPDEWKQRLSSTVGVEYDQPTWDAWEAFNSVKGACVNLTALDVFARTARPNPDLLAIGIAVHLRFLARALELTAPGQS